MKAKKDMNIDAKHDILMAEFLNRYQEVKMEYMCLKLDIDHKAFFTLVPILTQRFDMVIFSLHAENCKYTVTVTPSCDVRPFHNTNASRVTRLEHMFANGPIWPSVEVLTAFIDGYNAKLYEC